MILACSRGTCISHCVEASHLLIKIRAVHRSMYFAYPDGCVYIPWISKWYCAPSTQETNAFVAEIRMADIVSNEWQHGVCACCDDPSVCCKVQTYIRCHDVILQNFYLMLSVRHVRKLDRIWGRLSNKCSLMEKLVCKTVVFYKNLFCNKKKSQIHRES